MSGGSLPRTGVGAVTVGGFAGLGAFTMPAPVFWAAIGVAAVIVGALLIRVSFRRNTAAR